VPVRCDDAHGSSADRRLAIVNREIDNLTANMLTGVPSPSLLKLLGDREAAKVRLES
jgi:archaellum biogenesis ATPase FlaH